MTLPQAAAYMRGENIFDAKYEEVFSFRAPGAAVYAGLRAANRRRVTCSITPS